MAKYSNSISELTSQLIAEYTDLKPDQIIRSLIDVLDFTSDAFFDRGLDSEARNLWFAGLFLSQFLQVKQRFDAPPSAEIYYIGAAENSTKHHH